MSHPQPVSGARKISRMREGSKFKHNIRNNGSDDCYSSFVMFDGSRNILLFYHVRFFVCPHGRSLLKQYDGANQNICKLPIMWLRCLTNLFAIRCIAYPARSPALPLKATISWVAGQGSGKGKLNENSLTFFRSHARFVYGAQMQHRKLFC